MGVLAFTGCATQAQSQMPQSASAQTLEDLLRAQGYTAIALRRASNGLDTISVGINGSSGTFLLDTGASNTVIDRRALSKFRIAPASLRRSDTATGAGGTIAISSYAISGLSINRRDFALREVGAVDLSSLTTAFSRDTGIRLDGIVGQDVMISFDGIIDTKNRTLFLRER